MRRNDREITEFSEMTDVMKRCDGCRLALNDEEGYPYLLPLNFGMEETDGRVTLYFHGAKEGKKYDLIRKHARARFVMKPYYPDRTENFVVRPAVVAMTEIFCLTVEHMTGKKRFKQS